MEESWEEKTERLEREYQARIDRLRAELDCGQDGPCAKSPGCNRHWEERNRELVQRVAELERCMQEVGLLAFMQDATPGDITAHMTRVMDSYVQRIAELQSQLAWTPVSAGLPTEPGVYEFLGHALNIHLFTRHADDVYPPWAMVGIDELYESSELERGYTDFRAVALPKGGDV